MSQEQNGAALGKFAKAANTGNYDLFDAVVAADCIDYDPGRPWPSPWAPGYCALFTEMRQAFPDMKVEVAEMLANDDDIAFAYTFTGTHNGPLMGIAPTGKKVKFRGLQISKFSAGKMVERWGSSDQFVMLQQIGVSTIPKA